MTSLLKLRDSVSLNDIARLLGYTPKTLSYILYRIPESEKYRTFEIPKRSGGMRLIKAPCSQLSVLQDRLSELLQNCIEEIVREDPDYQVASFGFQRKESIVTNANLHKRRRYVFNIDLMDFFGAINFGRVRGVFIKDRRYSLSPQVATVIAQIACHDNCLPQGSPCSPVISNIVGNILDARLLRLAAENNCVYTRYADDLTFSTNEKIFPLAIAREVGGAAWEVGDRLSAIIQRSGFIINSKKTRMSLKRSRQTVTGLIVNSKPNVAREYYRSVRSICHSIFNDGFWTRTLSDQSKVKVSSLNSVEGMLSHVYFVKSRRDRSYQANKINKFIAPQSHVDLYRKFLFYKYFIASEKPVIITEGISDIIYMKCAIRARRHLFPSLASPVSGALKVTFLNASGTSRSLLDLGNGAAGQGKLLIEYPNRVKKYKHCPMRKPVIILCDNDSGPKDVFKNAKKFGVEVTLKTNAAFYHVTKNLYIVKVPEGGLESRDIEDLFPKEVLETVISGKKFDKDKDHADHTSYGKSKFATDVVRQNASKIDFRNFDELIGRIDECISDYKSRRYALK